MQNPEKPSWDVDEWLDTIANGDKDVVTLLWQVIAECLNGNYTRKRFFMIVGNGNNGKGTFQELLKNLIGENNVSALSMEQIGEKFSPAQLIGKTLNIGDAFHNLDAVRWFRLRFILDDFNVNWVRFPMIHHA